MTMRFTVSDRPLRGVHQHWPGGNAVCTVSPVRGAKINTAREATP
jgi:hypothetical protein